MSHVHRIVIIAPFFAKSHDTADKSDDTQKHSGSGNDRQVKYSEQLQDLESHLRTWLPKRVQVRTPFQQISTDEVEAAFKLLELTPTSLFKNGARMSGGKYPEPDLATVRRLSDRLKADAILLEVMDEPRRDNGKYIFDPIAGVGYDSPKVVGRAGFYLLAADGVEILHSYTEVLHPASKLGHREFVVADWEETEDQVIEDFMDELSRYLPNPLAPIDKSKHQ